jgi:hypothetical protein
LNQLINSFTTVGNSVNVTPHFLSGWKNMRLNHKNRVLLQKAIKLSGFDQVEVNFH